MVRNGSKLVLRSDFLPHRRNNGAVYDSLRRLGSVYDDSEKKREKKKNTEGGVKEMVT